MNPFRWDLLIAVIVGSAICWAIILWGPQP